MHVRESPVDAVVAIGQLGVVDAELAQDGGVDVVNFRRVLPIERFVTPLVAFAIRGATLDSATAQPIGEDIRIVIPPLATLR